MFSIFKKRLPPLKKKEFDYIIVGGGSAGCVLANRLSANPNTEVCLLEAGPVDSSLLIKIPAGIAQLITSEKLNWCYETEPQPRLKGREIFWPRGKTLGGSSAINAMIYTRGHPSDYDEWESLGNNGWGWKDVLPYFKKSEHHEKGQDEFHGVNGPLNVTDTVTTNILSSVFLNAAKGLGYKANNDFNGEDQEGVGFYQVTQKNGARCSAANAYLHPVSERPNLTVITDAHATSIYTNNKTAEGVTFTAFGESFFIKAKKEVILSGGAINSPQLLLLSGIGPNEELSKHGIPQVHELPGVGKNLQDHLDILIVQRSVKDVAMGYTPRFLLGIFSHLWKYFVHSKGPLTSNVAEAGGFVKTSPELAKPDIQLHLTAGLLDENGRNFLWGSGYSLHACQLRPRSKGEIGLHSRDPMVPARMEPNYIADQEDLEDMVKGVKICRDILAEKSFDPYRGKELFPGKDVQSDEQIREFVREKATTIYHPIGTCKMGSDSMAVVDETLKVHGIDQLRVIDASIIPTLIGGNTNAPTMMIAEKAADMILNADGQMQTELGAQNANEKTHEIITKMMDTE